MIINATSVINSAVISESFQSYSDSTSAFQQDVVIVNTEESSKNVGKSEYLNILFSKEKNTRYDRIMEYVDKSEEMFNIVSDIIVDVIKYEQISFELTTDGSFFYNILITNGKKINIEIFYRNLDDFEKEIFINYVINRKVVNPQTTSIVEFYNFLIKYLSTEDKNIDLYGLSENVTPTTVFQNY